MKYEELVKKLRGCADFCCIKCELETEEFCRFKLESRAADAIEELLGVIQRQKETINAIAYLPLYQKPKWIPVKEKLPEKGKVVLCHCRASIIETLCLEDDGHWLGYSGRYMKSFVTHWMPLPEPPKEETDG